MPKATRVLVERLRRAGVIAIGKTNVPEFGLGSHTYNKVYGVTVNPYDLDEERGRLQRRRGGGARRRHAAARGRQRLRRLPAQPGQLQQHRRASSHGRPGADGPGPLPLLGFVVKGPMARSRRRHRLPVERDGGARCPRSRLLSRPILRPFAGRWPQPQTACGWHGPPIWAAFRSTRACAPCSRRSARPSSGSAASSRTSARI